jgi:serine-type D-Ala-D-Ala carboxypeptidase (penicillin-binding protein 5/6)
MPWGKAAAGTSIAATGVLAVIALCLPAPMQPVAAHHAAQVLPRVTPREKPLGWTLPTRLIADWPDQGQAAIAVSTAGYGLIGSSGPIGSPQPIASVAKTMTAYLILRDHPLSPGQQGPVITVLPAEAAAYGAQEAENQSLVPVRAGEQLTENQALQALILASADNIAHILARWDAGGDQAFEAKMNAAAVQLGMTHSTFTDPSGYAPSTRSTAPDLIKLGEAAMADPYFASLVDQTSATIPMAGDIWNYNSLLGVAGINGIKTGSTGQAGGCLLFSAATAVHGHPVTLVGAVLGQDAPSGRELSTGLAAARRLVVTIEQSLRG